VPDSVATGAVKYLSTFTDVTSQLAAFSVSDPNAANAGKPWLFADNNQGVLATLEGSQGSALVCADAGGWGVPPQLGSQRFRRLRIDVWTDPLRDVSNNITETSVYTANRCLSVFNRVQFRLQRLDPDTVLWGDLCTIGCQLLTEPQPAPVSDGDNLLWGTAYFGVLFSGWTDATE
jgi:hypothetical protein